MLNTARCRNMRASVTGLKGGSVFVHLVGDEIEIKENGLHKIPDSSWIYFRYDGPSLTLICSLDSD